MKPQPEVLIFSPEQLRLRNQFPLPALLLEREAGDRNIFNQHSKLHHNPSVSALSPVCLHRSYVAIKTKYSLPSATWASSVTCDCSSKVLDNYIHIGPDPAPNSNLNNAALNQPHESPMQAPSCCNSAEEAVHRGANLV